MSLWYRQNWICRSSSICSASTIILNDLPEMNKQNYLVMFAEDNSLCGEKSKVEAVAMVQQMVLENY